MNSSFQNQSGLIAPRQKRSEQTLARIVQGALTLLANGTPNEITVEDIANTSGVAVGTIYRRFASREALLQEILRRAQIDELNELRHELERSKWVGKNLSSRLDWLVKRQRVRALRAPGLVRAVFTRITEQPGGPGEESVRLTGEAVAEISEWLLGADGVRKGVDRDAIAVITQSLMTSINLVLLYPDTFAPHGAGKATIALRTAAGAALESLCGDS